jgi:hypothetical protein
MAGRYYIPKALAGWLKGALGMVFSNGQTAKSLVSNIN